MKNFQIDLKAGCKSLLLALLAVCTPVGPICNASTTPLVPQTEDSSSSERKVLARVEPEYPETLKRLFIGGIVRVEATVTPSGNVESTQLIGGNPILGQSAMKAVKQWKYAPGSVREKVVVKLTFDPHR